MIHKEQLPEAFLELIEEQRDIFESGSTIQERNKIPDTKNIPIQNPNHWLKIPNIVCVFVDMKGSTKLSATNYDKSTASVFQFFTKTAIRIFNEFEAPYIDVKGDGVLALFNEEQPFTAIAAAITFRTFAEYSFTPLIKQRTGLLIKSHIGIDQKTVLVRKIGFKRHDGRTDRQNEVWAGKPVNMASKLSSLSNGDEILVSDRFFKNIDNDLVRISCGCPNGEKVSLWEQVDLKENKKFDFDSAYTNKRFWCKKHGTEYLEKIRNLD